MLTFKNMGLDDLLLLLVRTYALSGSRKYHKPVRLGMHHGNKQHRGKIKRCFLNGSPLKSSAEILLNSARRDTPNFSKKNAQRSGKLNGITVLCCKTKKAFMRVLSLSDKLWIHCVGMR